MSGSTKSIKKGSEGEGIGELRVVGGERGAVMNVEKES